MPVDPLDRRRDDTLRSPSDDCERKTGALDACFGNGYMVRRLLANGDQPVRLTQFSNFAIRVLMYTALQSDRLCTVPEMARAYKISYDHLKKAAAELCRLGYLQTARGRNGGFRLAMAPEAIPIGEVIRRTEGDVTLVECFDPRTNSCPLIAACRLRIALQDALAAFFAELDRYTVADLIAHPHQLSPLLWPSEQASGLDWPVARPACPTSKKV